MQSVVVLKLITESLIQLHSEKDKKLDAMQKLRTQEKPRRVTLRQMVLTSYDQHHHPDEASTSEEEVPALLRFESDSNSSTGSQEDEEREEEENNGINQYRSKHNNTCYIPFKLAFCFWIVRISRSSLYPLSRLILYIMGLKTKTNILIISQFLSFDKYITPHFKTWKLNLSFIFSCFVGWWTWFGETCC